MKTAERLKHPDVPNVRINPELNKYKDIILFPEKLARVNRMLETVNLPEQLNKIKQGK